MVGAPDRAGFADPVAEAQSCFRAVLDAMARPGTIRRVCGTLDPPAPFCPAAGAVLLTLLDQESPLWLDPAAKAARDWLGFHCGAPFVPQPEAAFIFALELPALDRLRMGCHEAPEEGATVVLQVRRLGTGRSFQLSGPGVDGTAVLAADGLPEGFARQWAANRAAFPLGVDLILCAGSEVAALPRGISVEAP